MRVIATAVAVTSVAALAIGLAIADPLGDHAAAASAPTPGARASAPTRTPLDAAGRIALARRHAPELRFNAWFPDPEGSPQNRNESHLPMSVDRFFADLERREATVVVRPAEGPAPALARRASFGGRPHVSERAIEGYPPLMVGDPPGEAPIYADAYPDPDDADVYFVEYWSYYPYDENVARFANVVGGIGSHRADWEHIALRLRLDAGGTRSTIVDAVYYGHEHAISVDPALLEIVDGAHPVVYVAVGKHASYPEPGEWWNYLGLEPAVQFDDVFHGNGVRMRTWEGEVVDIARAATPRPWWLDYRGLWGGDDRRIFGVSYALASRGPWAHRVSNDRFRRITGSWTGVKARFPGLRCDRDRGLRAPLASPPPVPILIR